MATTEELDARITRALRASGNRVTTQRLVLHRHLASQDQHLTAEQTHRAVASELPGVSVQTIYSTLELFERLDLVQRVSSPGGPIVFDTRLTPHHHAVCTVCGLVVDLEEDVDDTGLRRAASAAGFEPDRSEMVVQGRCATCAAQA